MTKETFGDATIYFGACEDILPALPIADVVVTDPPYIMDAGGTGDQYRRQVKQIRKEGLNTGFDLSILKHGKQWLSFCSKAQIVALIQHAEENELRWMLRTWLKSNPVPLTNRTYKPDTEYMVHAFLNHAYEGKNRYVLGPIEINKYGHPTVKPMYVMLDALNCSTDVSDMVYDPFMGTGSTGVACLRMGRKFVGIEKEQKYFDIACERLYAENKQLKLL